MQKKKGRKALSFWLNIFMIIKHEDDFPRMYAHIKAYRKRFPMFYKDIERIKNNIDKIVKEYGILQIKYRQTHSSFFLNLSDQKLQEINDLINVIDKIELLSILSKK